MSSPLVSVLIPCHNAEKYIGETLESVFRQSWRNIEVVVINDGSTDGSLSELGRFCQNNLRVISQLNSGAGAARNRAFAESRGDFIQFLDADDLIGPDKIELQMRRLITQPGAVASAEWGRFYTTAADTQFDKDLVGLDLEPLEWLIASRSSGLGMLFPALWLVPRPIVESAGPWDTTLSLGDDGEYFTRVLLRSRLVLFCKGAFCYYRSGLPNSLSRSRNWQSQYQVTSLCEEYVRSHEDSERVRRGFALSWQHLAHSAYPYDAALAEHALIRARAIHNVVIQPEGGFAFRALSSLFGWRTARRLQIAFGRV